MQKIMEFIPSIAVLILVVSGVVYPALYYTQSQALEVLVAQQGAALQQVTAERDQMAKAINDFNERMKQAQAQQQAGPTQEE